MNKAVIFSTNNAEWGGSEEVWRSICLKMSRFNYQILASAIHYTSKEKKVRELERDGVTIQWRKTVLKPEGSINGIIYNQFERNKNGSSSNKYWREIIRFNPKFVLFNLGESFENEFILQYNAIQKNLLGKIPYIIFSHFVSNDFPNLDVLQRNKLKTLYQSASKVFFVSHQNAKVTIRQLGLKTIPYVVFKEQELPEISENLQRKKVSRPIQLACVARLEHSTKGQDILLEYFGQYHAKEEFHINFYGTGESFNHLNNLRSFYNLENHSTFHGFESDKNKIWSDNDALILFSKDEGLPLSLLEAASFGKSFVATNSGGIADLQAKLGYRFNAVNKKTFFNVLDEIRLNPDSIISKGMNCYNWVNSYVDTSSYSLLDI